MKKWKATFAVASGFFGIIPGLTVLSTNIGVPPDSSKLVFFGVIESLGIFTLLILQLNKDSFMSYPVKTVNKMALTAIALFIISLFLYLFLFSEYVTTLPDHEALFFPIWPQGELQRGLSQLGGKASLIQEWGRDDVFKVIRSSSSSMLTLTTLIFLFVYQLIFVCLTFAFGLLALRINAMETD